MNVYDKYKYYVGDVNLECGGMFINIDNWKYGYADVLVITDLDSGAGFPGAVEVSLRSVVTDNPEWIKSALQFSGGIHGDTSEWRKVCIVESLVYYMGGDPCEDFMGPYSLIIQVDSDGSSEFDGWKADVILSESDDLLSYLERETGWLSNFE